MFKKLKVLLLKLKKFFIYIIYLYTDEFDLKENFSSDLKKKENKHGKIK
jgi:hypothetical protein